MKEVQSRKNQHSNSEESLSTLQTSRLAQSRQPSTATSASTQQVNIKSEPTSETEDLHFDIFASYDRTDDFSDIVVKEEPEYRPIILRDQITAQIPEPIAPPRQRRNHSLTGIRGLHESQISYGAQKMRAYRERLKEPANRMKLLRQKQLQREWNRRAYIKKQIQNGLPIRTRRRDYSTYFGEMATDSAQSTF